MEKGKTAAFDRPAWGPHFDPPAGSPLPFRLPRPCVADLPGSFYVPFGHSHRLAFIGGASAYAAGLME